MIARSEIMIVISQGALSFLLLRLDREIEFTTLIN